MSTSARRLFDDLRTLRVLVIHPPGDDRSVLEEQLRRIGCPVRVLWPFPSQLPADADAIFFLLVPRPGVPEIGVQPILKRRLLHCPIMRIRRR